MKRRRAFAIEHGPDTLVVASHTVTRIPGSHVDVYHEEPYPLRIRYRVDQDGPWLGTGPRPTDICSFDLVHESETVIDGGFRTRRPTGNATFRCTRHDLTHHGPLAQALRAGIDHLTRHNIDPRHLKAELARLT